MRLASLHQLQAWGSERAMLVTISSNEPAVRLYSTMGFTRADIAETGSYQKCISQGDRPAGIA